MVQHRDVALVTGGTGFTGRILVRKLLDRGFYVRVLARPSSDRSSFDGLKVDWITGHVFDDAAVERATRGVDYVFNLAAAYRDASIADEVYSRVHVTGTEMLARGAARNPGFKRFVHISTVGVLGHIENPPADERAPFNPGDIYQRTKMEAEVWLGGYAAETGLPCVVLRPAAIYGPGDRRLLKLFKLAQLPVVPLIGETRGLYHLVHVDDLTDFMLFASDDPRCVGETFICGDNEATSIRDIVSAVADYFGRKPRFVQLPSAPFFAAAAICERIFPPLGIKPPLFKRRVAFFTKDRAFDTTKMRSTGFRCRHSGEAGVIATADWYRRAGWLSWAAAMLVPL